MFQLILQADYRLRALRATGARHCWRRYANHPCHESTNCGSTNYRLFVTSRLFGSTLPTRSPLQGPSRAPLQAVPETSRTPCAFAQLQLRACVPRFVDSSGGSRVLGTVSFFHCSGGHVLMQRERKILGELYNLTQISRPSLLTSHLSSLKPDADPSSRSVIRTLSEPVIRSLP